MRLALTILAGGLAWTLMAWTLPVSADRLHLQGGAVLEGRVVEEGTSVVIEVESGRLTFSARDVLKVERAPSQLEQFEAQLAQIKPGDVPALLRLANFCRDHELPAREREVLRKLLESQPDHAEARLRLGYVRSDAGWVRREELQLSRGLVRHEGRWVSRAEMLELSRLAAQTKLAALERDKAQLELEARRAELEAGKAAQRAQASSAERAARGQADSALWFVPVTGCRGSCPQASPASAGPSQPFLPGVRHPSDMSFSLPGVRDPKSYF